MSPQDHGCHASGYFLSFLRVFSSIVSRKTRILFVVNDPVFFLSHRLPLAKAARSKGYEVHVATPEESGAEEIRAAGFPFHSIPLKRLSRKPWHELIALFGLYRLFRRLKPDLLHLVTIKPVLYGGLMARLAGVPYVVCAISGLGYVFSSSRFGARLIRPFARVVYRRSLAHPRLRVIFQNPENLEYFLKSHLVAPEKAVLIKGAGVDMTVFAPSDEPEEQLLVILASRMLWDKGIGEFVEAARLFQGKGKKARFALLGDPAPGNPLDVPRDQLEAWDQEGVVEWWGFQKEMFRVFQNCHLVCLPTYYGEGVPKVLIEAAASARAIVACDVPGCREVVRHGETGLLIRPRDPRALCEAIEYLLLNGSLRRAMGRKGRELVATEFSLEKVVATTLELYQELTRSAGTESEVRSCT